ncbi:hypothetical protein ACWDBD_21840 [Streptomyces sp. NPDC001118]
MTHPLSAPGRLTTVLSRPEPALGMVVPAGLPASGPDFEVLQSAASGARNPGRPHTLCKRRSIRGVGEL